MHWGEILSSSFFFYVRFGVVFGLYWIAAYYVGANRSSPNPPFSEKLWIYLKAIAAAAVMGGLAGANFSDDVHPSVDGIDAERSAIVFLTILIALFAGIAKGYRIEKSEIPTGSSSDVDL